MLDKHHSGDAAEPSPIRPSHGRELEQADTRADGTAVLLVKGVLIGVANIIPGVSGGTFALILGIFDRLIRSLKSLDLHALRVCAGALGKGLNAEARAELLSEVKRTDVMFLVRIGAGAVAALMALSFAIDWLLVNQPALTLAFFIGLILPSIVVPWRMMDRHTPGVLVWLVPGIALTVGVSVAFGRVGTASTGLGMAFVSGVIAVSAMILPGISGSFVLLVMGQYQNVLQNLQSLQTGLVSARIEWQSAIWLAALAAGCVVGLVTFARLLGYVLARFRSATLAFLIGLILGSFWVLWPFKDYGHGAQVVSHRGEVKHKVKVATAPNQLPRSGREVGLCAAALALGLAGAVGVNALGKTGQPSHSPPSQGAGNDRQAS